MKHIEPIAKRSLFDNSQKLLRFRRDRRANLQQRACIRHAFSGGTQTLTRLNVNVIAGLHRLSSARAYISAKICFVRALVFREPDIAIDAKNAALWVD